MFSIAFIAVFNRVFPGESVEEERLQKGIPQQSQRNPWLTGSLTYMLRLSLMAVGGYNPGSIGVDDSKSTTLVESLTQKKRRQNRFMEFASFSFQNTDDFCGNLASTSTNLFADVSGNSTQGNLSASEQHKDNAGVQIGTGSNLCRIAVSRVQFARSDEVDLLLLETVKTFADIICSTPAVISKHALFCLNVSFSE